MEIRKYLKGFNRVEKLVVTIYYNLLYTYLQLLQM